MSAGGEHMLLSMNNATSAGASSGNARITPNTDCKRDRKNQILLLSPQNTVHEGILAMKIFGCLEGCSFAST